MLDRAQYDRFRVSPADPATLRCDNVEAALETLAESSGGRLQIEKVAESVEGRPIYLATIGSGTKRVLMWSQMHGDEPTHTGVVLDLLSYLLRTPAEPLAADLLKHCTLLIIPMLNPDGAERVVRFNAHGIDINRDWRRLATPEARALRRAAETLKPQFAFNLHNQNARTSVGRPPLLAAVSVLAPAPDGTRTESPSMRVGKQMCTCFVEAVRPHAQGMISRYDDAYEPRAFGDGIQSLGIATMLVEAGGWPEADPEPMTRLHFHGLLATLHAIATDKYRAADTHIYEDLPESNSSRMNDCFIAKAHVLDAKVAQPFLADLLIDQSHSVRLAFTKQRDGKIIEIGDLPLAPSRLPINASGSLILPGQIRLLSDWSPAARLDERRLNELLAQGTTTVVGVVNLADRDAVEAIGAPQSLPVNWGFVADADRLGTLKGCELLERLAIAAAGGLLAVISQAADESLWRTIHPFGLPLLRPSQIPANPAGSYRDAAQQVWNAASALNLQSRRGRIDRGCVADLLFFESAAPADASPAADWKSLRRVMVAGEPVWENGNRKNATPGILVRRG
jgi:Zinc carboxypeptidase